MSVGKLRDSGLYRAKLNLFSWSGRVDFPPRPVTRKVLIRCEPDNCVRVSRWPSKIDLADQLFDDGPSTVLFAARFSLKLKRRSAMLKPQHIIELSADPFDLHVDVAIKPVPEGEILDRSFEQYAVARQYADGLAKLNGWVLVDRLDCDPVMAG